MIAGQQITGAWLAAPETRKVMAALEAAKPGCARFVGGCVRNTLMGRTVDDIDIATQLVPEEAMAALQTAGIRTEPTGIEHGTLTAIVNHQPFEITSLRRDVETDGRRAVVAFTTDWNEDAQRRDFRLNALYADADGTLFDPTGGGLDDAASGRVIFIGDADERLREDYLRALRFFRFNAWYGAGIDAEGLAACTRQAEGLRKIAVERIWREMEKLLRAPEPAQAVEAMQQSGTLSIILPNLREGSPAAGLSTLCAMEKEQGLQIDSYQRLMAIIPRTPSAAQAIADHLRLPNKGRDRLLSWASPGLSAAATSTEQGVRRCLYLHGAEAVRDFAISETRPELLALLATAGAPGSFPLGGKDLLEMGMQPGPAVGELIAQLEAWWIEDDFAADRKQLLTEAQRRLTAIP